MRQRPSSLARCRLFFSRSRAYCLRSGRWFLFFSYSRRLCRRSSSSSGVAGCRERLTLFGFAGLDLRLVGFRFGVDLTGSAMVYWKWILLENRRGEPPASAPARSDRRVYPRACGGTPGRRCSDDTRGGLSPRVRGNHHRRSLPGLDGGSIPVRAGEPPPRRAGRRGARVYPRACGGTSTAKGRAKRCTGLSPRVRGNPSIDTSCHAISRSIPARAGEPRAERTRAWLTTVYPRACGGTTLRTERLSNNEGLSPRVRGNHGHGYFSWCGA